jgi:biopolymer transport protein ExbD
MISRKHRRGVGLLNVPVSAMIDIVFLLIIFFVVTIDIERDAADQEIELPLLNHGKPIRLKKADRLTINIRGNGDITLEGQVISVEYLEKVVRMIARKWGNTYSIVIRGDRKAEFGQTNKVIKVIGNIGFTNVSFCAELTKKQI